MKLITAFSCACFVFAAYHAAGATIYTFDDVSPVEYTMIQDGYGGLQWDNFFIENGLNAPGFLKGTVSSPNVAFDGLGKPASIRSADPFTLESAYFTSVYVPAQQIRAQGFTRGFQTYDHTFTVNNTAPTLIDFNYVGIDQVTFTILTSPGGIFAMDNLVVVIPEPGVCALFTVAAALGALGRLRKLETH